MCKCWILKMKTKDEKFRKVHVFQFVVRRLKYWNIRKGVKRRCDEFVVTLGHRFKHLHVRLSLSGMI